MESVSVIILAAGSGARAGFNKNKLLVPFFGANALYYALQKFSDFGEIIVTASSGDFGEIEALAARFGAKTVLGGKTRTESVYNALKEVSKEVVLIHDGARPFVSREAIARCAKEAELYGSAVVAAPATDTTAVAKDGLIDYIPARESVYRLQTPQGFLSADIRRAYEEAIKSGKSFTDDSSVYSEYISPARICPCGDESNVKLTYRKDFENFALPSFPAIKNSKTGFGVDVHAFAKSGNCVTLCGVEIPCDGSLIAHSDGDVIFHAVTDAVLSAAGLNDIGHYFPENDPAYDGAESGKLFLSALNEIKKKGLKIRNLSISVQAEKPRLKPYIEKMKENLARLAEVGISDVAIAAGTCEGLGYVGEGLGICAYCAATLQEDDDNGEN